MLNNLFHEGILPDVLPEPPLVQLKAMLTCSVTSCLGEEADPHLAITLFQVFEKSSNASMQSPFLQENISAASAAPHMIQLFRPS